MTAVAVQGYDPLRRAALTAVEAVRGVFAVVLDGQELSVPTDKQADEDA